MGYIRNAPEKALEMSLDPVSISPICEDVVVCPVQLQCPSAIVKAEARIQSSARCATSRTNLVGQPAQPSREVQLQVLCFVKALGPPEVGWCAVEV